MKHAKWVEVYKQYAPPCEDDGEVLYKCSRCGVESEEESKYCKTCGARMDGAKQAEWVDTGKTVKDKHLKAKVFKCSNCGREVIRPQLDWLQFCPTCGEEMKL